ncbi:hypothetical protein [Kribbella swartbergensis]
MRFVQISALVEDGRRKGYSLDANLYLHELPRIAEDLPRGARAFALDEDHYNFFARKCVKDLKLRKVTMLDRNDALGLRVEFEPNRFKHDGALTIDYSNVIEFSVNVSSEPRRRDGWPETRRLGEVQLDEILPDKHGCSHEVQMTGGSLFVLAADLNAQWSDEVRPFSA